MIAMIHFARQHIGRADAADTVCAFDIYRDGHGLKCLGSRLVRPHRDRSAASCEKKSEGMVRPVWCVGNNESFAME
jgi:hypothetical protein